MIISGSRPVSRQLIGGGEAKLPRAIPHNTILFQIGILANVLYGLGRAIRNDGPAFGKMMQESKEFRMRIGMVDRVFMESDPYIMRAYIELFNPDFGSKERAICKEKNAKHAIKWPNKCVH